MSPLFPSEWGSIEAPVIRTAPPGACRYQLSSSGSGSTGRPPNCQGPPIQISKCKCGPLEDPVDPTRPSSLPVGTTSPSLTLIEPLSMCMKT